MCTLLVASRVFPETPLFVAANRDERLDRPAAPPSLHRIDGLAVLAPLDLRAGGTWIGLSSAGVLAGLTNRFGSVLDGSRRSRGELVFEALREPTADRAAARVARVDAVVYNAFHLFVADRGALHRLWSDGARLHHDVLPPGFHALTERSLGAADDRRSERLLSWARGFAESGAAPTDAAVRARLGFHDPTDPFAGTCLHLPPELPYGTRSSSIVRLGRDASDFAFAHADGPPCKTPHGRVDDLLRDGGGAR